MKAFAEYGTLPSEAGLRNAGSEWFLQLLANPAASTRIELIFMFWRTWHHRNNLIHGYGKASVAASVPFLHNYVTSLKLAKEKGESTKHKALYAKCMGLVVPTPKVTQP